MLFFLRCGFLKYEFVFPVRGHTVQYHKGIDSIVGIVTPYGLEGSGFELRFWQEIFSFPHSFRASWIPSTLMYYGHKVCLLWIKGPGRSVDRSPISSPNLSIGRNITLIPNCAPSETSNGDLYIYQTT